MAQNEGLSNRFPYRRGAWVRWKYPAVSEGTDTKAGETFYTARPEDYADLHLFDRPAFLAKPKQEAPSDE